MTRPIALMALICAFLATGCLSAQKARSGSVLATARIKTKNSPSPRALHTAVWTGESMIVWGGMSEGRKEMTPGRMFYPASQKWFPLPSQAARPRYHHSTVWTGIQMIIWGGVDSQSGLRSSTGAMLDIEDEQWFPVTSSGAPSPRSGHSAVWTGDYMIVFGGEGEDGFFADGGIYDLVEDKWEPLPVEGGPPARGFHTAVWTGTHMLIFGGLSDSGALGDAWAYDPKTKTWAELSSDGAPKPRFGHTALWTGRQMLIWGGKEGEGYNEGWYDDGAALTFPNPTWTPISERGAPPARDLHTAIWTGTEMIVWGGLGVNGPLADGGAYNPATDTWRRVRSSQKTPPRYMHSAVWTGKEMLIFGGRTDDGYVDGKALGLSIKVSD